MAWQVRMWHSALKWIALWLTLSILTLLHAFGLVHSMANVSLAKVNRAMHPCSASTNDCLQC